MIKSQGVVVPGARGGNTFGKGKGEAWTSWIVLRVKGWGERCEERGEMLGKQKAGRLLNRAAMPNHRRKQQPSSQVVLDHPVAGNDLQIQLR